MNVVNVGVSYLYASIFSYATGTILILAAYIDLIYSYDALPAYFSYSTKSNKKFKSRSMPSASSCS